MNKLIGILLAIIMHTPSSLHGHALAKREPISQPAGARELISELPKSRGNFWLEENGDISYRGEYVKDANENPQSRLLSSLIDGFEELEKLQYPEIQSMQQSQPQDSLPQVQHQQREEHEEQQELEEQQATGEQKEYDEQDGEEYEEQHEKKDREYYEEEYRRLQEKKLQKPAVHLFGPMESQLRGTLERFEARDLQRSQQSNSNFGATDDNQRISRVGKPLSNHFSYIHPEEWALNTPECSGRRQSPVNLDSDKLVGLDLPSSLIWTGYWNQPQNMTITDNGHSVELSGTWATDMAPFIGGGPLVGDYVFAQLHFHWGPEDSVGSEHTINNKSFPMEMHMVHYKRDYQTLKDALKHNDGLAVIAFLFEIGETFNFGINLLEDNLSKIQNKPGIGIPVKPYPLAFLHSMFEEDYASYIGSLTTPPCREIVTWLVSSSPLSISRRQLEFFRKISNKWPEKENYRPRQALNGRRLYYVAH